MKEEPVQLGVDYREIEAARGMFQERESEA